MDLTLTADKSEKGFTSRRCRRRLRDDFVGNFKVIFDHSWWKKSVRYNNSLIEVIELIELMDEVFVEERPAGGKSTFSQPTHTKTPPLLEKTSMIGMTSLFFFSFFIF